MFEDRTAPPKPKKMKSPWNYDCPKYDERSSCFVNAGSHYGVGFAQPIGHEGNPKSKVPALPQNRYKVSTMKIDEVPYRNEEFEIER